MNDVCNKINKKIKVTHLKAFTYTDDIMISSDMKEFKIRLAHPKESKNYGLQIIWRRK
jgi:hypothetical protein